ncbi:MAG: TRL-like protein family [Kiritimatiellae bacterium]|nr:TRL-like protein family [Kiritimatiellia bacterium]MBR4603967.1 TRL-like protein family [Kiritimatiellia bacterium]
MKKLLVVAALAFAASGCVMVRHSNAVSALTLDVQSPATSFIDNSVQPLKKGTATASGIICFVEGDASLKAAMDNGGITKVHHVDYKVKNILGIIGSTTTIVWGE